MRRRAGGAKTGDVAIIVGRGARWRGQRTVLLDALQAAVLCTASEREVVLVIGRRWRADLAWPAHRVAVELQGGTFMGGHHVRPVEYRHDCEKILQAAAVAGWRIFPLTWAMLAEDLAGVAAALDLILACADPAHHEQHA